MRYHSQRLKYLRKVSLGFDFGHNFCFKQRIDHFETTQNCAGSLMTHKQGYFKLLPNMVSQRSKVGAQGSKKVKGGNDGVGEQGWSRRGRMVQRSRDGAGEQGWCSGAGMELGSGDGAVEQEWNCGARMELGSGDGAGERGWCCGAGMELGSKDGAGKQE